MSLQAINLEDSQNNLGIHVEPIDTFQYDMNGKQVIQYIFTYKCFCGASFAKPMMYSHLINEHNIPAGVVQMILNMSPVKSDDMESSVVNP